MGWKMTSNVSCTVARRLFIQNRKKHRIWKALVERFSNPMSLGLENRKTKAFSHENLQNSTLPLPLGFTFSCHFLQQHLELCFHLKICLMCRVIQNNEDRVSAIVSTRAAQIRCLISSWIPIGWATDPIPDYIPIRPVGKYFFMFIYMHKCM